MADKKYQGKKAVNYELLKEARQLLERDNSLAYGMAVSLVGHGSRPESAKDITWNL